MLTVRQLLVASGQSSGEVMHASALPRQFVGRSLSLRSAIAAYEKQRRTYFVSLVSPRIFLSDDVHTFEDLVRLSPDFHGQMTRDEVVALTTNLESHGVLVRLVDKDFRHAALIGTVPDLVSVPTTIVDGQNFVQIKDRFSGVAAVGGGVIGAGTVVVVLATAPMSVPLIIGIGIISFGSGLLIGSGIMDIQHDSPPAPTKESPDKTNSEVDSPDGQPDGDQDTIEIPNAVAIGDSPNGLDVDGLVTELGNLSLDLILSDIPIGWDPDVGGRLPGVIGDWGGEGDGDGINIPG